MLRALSEGIKFRGWPFYCFLRFGEIKEGDVVRHDGKRSDGYLEHIFKHAAKELFGMDVKEITYKALK